MCTWSDVCPADLSITDPLHAIEAQDARGIPLEFRMELTRNVSHSSAFKTQTISRIHLIPDKYIECFQCNRIVFGLRFCAPRSPSEMNYLHAHSISQANPIKITFSAVGKAVPMTAAHIYCNLNRFHLKRESNIERNKTTATTATPNSLRTHSEFPKTLSIHVRLNCTFCYFCARNERYDRRACNVLERNNRFW